MGGTYQLTEWTPRQSEHPARRRLVPVEKPEGDTTAGDLYDVFRAEGTVSTPGTSFNLDTMKGFDEKIGAMFPVTIPNGGTGGSTTQEARNNLDIHLNNFNSLDIQSGTFTFHAGYIASNGSVETFNLFTSTTSNTQSNGKGFYFKINDILFLSGMIDGYYQSHKPGAALLFLDGLPIKWGAHYNSTGFPYVFTLSNVVGVSYDYGGTEGYPPIPDNKDLIGDYNYGRRIYFRQNHGTTICSWAKSTDHRILAVFNGFSRIGEFS